jgi:putative ATPase
LAPTENPSFEVIPALLSRCQVYVLNRLQKIDLETLLERHEERRIDVSKNIELKETGSFTAVIG